MSQVTKNSWFDEYQKKAMDRIESILSEFNVEFKCENDKVISIMCPIHGSDSIGNSVIYLETGVWLCFSGNCHSDYGKSVLGLIKGILDKQGKPCSWVDVKRVIDGDHKVCPIILTKSEEVDIFKDEKSKPDYCIPSRYFMARGYKEETMRHFEVGDCHRGIYSNRAIVPIRYINGEYMGFSARSHWSECKMCKYHHSKYESCINKNQDFHFMYRKWLHSKGSNKSKTLYGIHKITNTNKLALVEGPGCVWKLWEYGIPAVACLGKDFSDLRSNLLESLGIEKILFIPDNDTAGQEFKNRFISNYHKRFDIFLPQLTDKDVGDMGDEDIKKFIVSKWEKIK